MTLRSEAAERGVSIWQVRKERGERPGGRHGDAVLIRMPEAVHDRLREAADARSVSANWLAVMAIEQYLADLIPADELRLTRPNERFTAAEIVAAMDRVRDRIEAFSVEMREQGIHVGLGSPAICVTCLEPWPCRGLPSGPA